MQDCRLAQYLWSNKSEILVNNALWIFATRRSLNCVVEGIQSYAAKIDISEHSAWDWQCYTHM